MGEVSYSVLASHPLLIVGLVTNTLALIISTYGVLWSVSDLIANKGWRKRTWAPISVCVLNFVGMMLALLQIIVLYGPSDLDSIRITRDVFVGTALLLLAFFSFEIFYIFNVIVEWKPLNEHTAPWFRGAIWFLFLTLSCPLFFLYAITGNRDSPYALILQGMMSIWCILIVLLSCLTNVIVLAKVLNSLKVKDQQPKDLLRATHLAAWIGASACMQGLALVCIVPAVLMSGPKGSEEQLISFAFGQIDCSILIIEMFNQSVIFERIKNMKLGLSKGGYKIPILRWVHSNIINRHQRKVGSAGAADGQKAQRKPDPDADTRDGRSDNDNTDDANGDESQADTDSTSSFSWFGFRRQRLHHNGGLMQPSNTQLNQQSESVAAMSTGNGSQIASVMGLAPASRRPSDMMASSVYSQRPSQAVASVSATGSPDRLSVAQQRPSSTSKRSSAAGRKSQAGSAAAPQRLSVVAVNEAGDSPGQVPRIDEADELEDAETPSRTDHEPATPGDDRTRRSSACQSDDRDDGGGGSHKAADRLQ
ncbi:hypothetical protein BC831DRAFT_470873 [Entophlyctis helioformis]|nr:hypothetical protein BC831DRAFT_470873 [Entophlyctis helioformis]